MHLRVLERAGLISRCRDAQRRLRRIVCKPLVEASACKLMTIFRADGAIDAKRVAYMEFRGTDKYEAFDIFLPLFYPTIGDRRVS